MTDDLDLPDDDEFEADLARWAKEGADAADPDADEDDGDRAKADPSSDPAVALLERFGKEPTKSEADLTFEAQMAEAEAAIAERDGVLPPHEDTEIERLAVKAAGMDASEMAFFKQQLQDQIDANARSLRAGTDGFDDDGDPAPVVDAFDPLTLSSADFKTFQEAVISGGASFTKVPAGETFESWQAKVNSALGR